MTIRAVPWGPAPHADHRPAPGTRRLPYHRLGHADPEHRWWKPLVELLLFGAFYLVLAIVFGIVWAVGLLAVRGEQALDELVLEATALDVMDPALFFMLFFSLVLMIPALLAARAITGPRPIGLLLSVTGRLRWGFLARTVLLALAVYAAGHGALLLLDYTVAGTLPPWAPVEDFWWIMAMVVLLVPLQCAAEELVFRGLLLQAVGRWLRRPVFAILLPVPLFTFGHLYNLWGLLAVATMAVVAGYLSWRTGGLEAAIGLHVVNNVLVFSIGAVGWVDPAAEEATWVSVASVLPIYLVFAWLVVRSTRKHGVEVTRAVHPPRPPARSPGLPGPGDSGWACPGPPACPGRRSEQPSGPALQRLP